jgi:hypothetical protein
VILEDIMRRYSLAWLAFCFLLVFSETSAAAGIEAAADAEKLIESCHDKDVVFPPLCINTKLKYNWKRELEYAGKRFSAIGYLDDVKKSLVGNFFAFVIVEKYKVGCKITQSDARYFSSIGNTKSVLISGVLDSYRLYFNVNRFHHLRLTPYCTIEFMT